MAKRFHRKVKHQNPFPKQRLVPRDPPKPISVGATITPKAILAEFKGYGVPYNIKKCSTSGAPAIQGFTCMAAWEVVHSDEKILEFWDVEDKLGNAHTLYHGTPTNNITTIAENGLRPGSGSCMFGAGIYMGGPGKAFGYTCPSYRSRHSMSLGTARYMLRVRAALGNVKECTHAEKWSLGRLQDNGFDSVAGVRGLTLGRYGALRGDEWVVYSPSQVLVERIFEYQATSEDPYDRTLPTSGACGIVIEKKTGDLGVGMSAFKDLLTKKACGNTAYTQVLTSCSGVSPWICNHCIERLKLKIGSRIEVALSYGGRGSKVVRIQKIR